MKSNREQWATTVLNRQPRAESQWPSAERRAPEKRLENCGKRSHWTTWLRRCLELPWAEMIVAVFCFHFALNNPGVIVRVVFASLGVILLAKAISEIIGKRTSTHSWPTT
jgi:hypothetical protein